MNRSETGCDVVNTNVSARSPQGERPAPIDVIRAGRRAAGCGSVPETESGERLGSGDDGCDEFLSVDISDQTCGIDIMCIKEIIKPRQVTEIPRAPASVSGVISLRGVIIPVLSTSELLGMKRASYTSEARVVVVTSATGYTGLLVNRVSKVVRVARDGIESAPDGVGGIDRTFLRGVGQADNRMLMLLDVERVADLPAW